MLSHPDVATKEPVIRRYDHEVQGATVVKPLVGVHDDGPSDAAVLKPLMTIRLQRHRPGLRYQPVLRAARSLRDGMGRHRRGDAQHRRRRCGPDRVAILDNFCWGNPNLPDRMGGLVRAAQGCHDAALAYGTPFISGKDSLNNEFVDAHGDKRTIPPTLLISSMGIVPDVRQTVTMDLKQPGNRLYVVGETRDELGGSLYHRLKRRHRQ